jgi:hypothetical protein
MLKKIFGNIFTPILIITLLIIFFFGYFMSLVIIEPRNITPIITFIDKKLNYNSKLNFKIEKAEIAWNKRNFSFDINFIQTSFNTEKYNIKIPHLTIDISRRSLLLKKFIIDKVVIPKLIINMLGDTNNSSKKYNNFNDIKSEIINILALDTKKIAILKHLLIYKLEINNNSDSFLFKNIKYSFLNYIEQKELKLGFTHVAEHGKSTKFGASCLVKKNYKVKKCDIKLGNIHPAIGNLKALSKNWDFTNANAELTLIINDKINLTSNILIDNLQIDTTEKLIKYPKLAIKNAIILEQDNLLTKFNIINSTSKAYIVIDNNFANSDLKLELSASQIKQEEIFLLWPKIYAKPVRNWLKKSLLKVNLDSFYLHLDLNMADKKLKNISGEFNVSDTDLKFTKAIKPLESITGKILLDNNLVNIQINEAKLENSYLKNYSSSLKYKARPMQLNINGYVDNINAKNINNFLLANTMNHKNLNILNEYFDNANLSGDLSMNIDIIKSFNIEDLAINFVGNIKGSVKNFILKDSTTKLILEKKYNENNFIIKADLDQANFSLPFIKSIKERDQALDASLNIIYDKNKLEFADIRVNNPDININGDIIINNTGLSKLKFSNVEFLKNHFDIDLQHNGKILEGNLYSRVINLDHKLTKGSGNSSLKNLNLNIQLDKLYIDGNYFNITGNILCKEVCQKVYIEGKYAKEDYFIFKKFENITGSYIDIITNNLGGLLNKFKLGDRITSGKMYLEIIKEKNSAYNGNLYLDDFQIKYESFLSNLNNLPPFKNQNLEQINFETGKAKFTFANNKLILKESIFYGNILGFTLTGEYIRKNNKIDMEGYLIPAYKLNNLFGISDIPLIGNALTGKQNQGLVSAKFKVNGDKNKQDIVINPFSAFIPSAVKNVGDLFKRSFFNDATKE